MGSQMLPACPQTELCSALQIEYERQVTQLSELIELITGQLSPNDRKKLVTLCTIDVHARDVVQRLLDERVDNVMAFQWQSQLRYSQHDKTRECQVASVQTCACWPAESASLAALHLSRFARR